MLLKHLERAHTGNRVSPGRLGGEQYGRPEQNRMSFFPNEEKVKGSRGRVLPLLSATQFRMADQVVRLGYLLQ